MAKITRFTGNLEAFASAATGTARTVFGDSAQSDTLDDNINADFLTGWEIVGTNDSPTRQDFNAATFTSTQLLSYLHQMGVAEYDSSQEYYEGSLAISGGELYKSLATGNTGNAVTDYTYWQKISPKRNAISTTDATPTIIITETLANNSSILIEAKINGSKTDYSESYMAVARYAVRNAGAGAVQVAAVGVDAYTDSAGAPAVTAAVNGDDARILVTGIAGNYDWAAEWTVTPLA